MGSRARATAAKFIFQPRRTRPIQYVFTLSSHIKTDNNPPTALTDSGWMSEEHAQRQRQEQLSPVHRTEWAVLHRAASIIHQAAENIIHIHKFSKRELWSRWYKRLYGSDHISHSGLINSQKASQMLLAAPHMLQLPETEHTQNNQNNNNNIK